MGAKPPVTLRAASHDDCLGEYADLSTHSQVSSFTEPLLKSTKLLSSPIMTQPAEFLGDSESLPKSDFFLGFDGISFAGRRLRSSIKHQLGAAGGVGRRRDAISSHTTCKKGPWMAALQHVLQTALHNSPKGYGALQHQCSLDSFRVSRISHTHPRR